MSESYPVAYIIKNINNNNNNNNNIPTIIYREEIEDNLELSMRTFPGTLCLGDNVDESEENIINNNLVNNFKFIWNYIKKKKLYIFRIFTITIISGIFLYLTLKLFFTKILF